MAVMCGFDVRKERIAPVRAGAKLFE